MRDLKEIGSFLQSKREEMGLTREGLCGDEKELTTRQLFRIEHGENWPTLNRFLLITEILHIDPNKVLDINLLLPPDDYLNMKQYLIERPVYGNKQILLRKKNYLEVIENVYFDFLSEEEQLTISILQLDLNFFLIKRNEFVENILPDYFHQIKMKQAFTINDLLIIKLILANEYFLKPTHSEISFCLNRLKKQASQAWGPKATLIIQIYTRLITNHLHTKNYDEIPSTIQTVNILMKSAMQFQQKPVILMLEGQYLLFCTGSVKKANLCYKKAITCARIFDNSFLVEQIQKQWESDRLKVQDF